MNRREFTRGLLSVGMTPALPVAAVGEGLASAKASADHMYFVSWYTARLNKTCSEQSLAAELNLSPDVAREVFGRLVSSNTVSVPNAMGVSQTLDPLGNSLRHLAHGAVPQGTVQSITGRPPRTTERLREWVQEAVETQPRPQTESQETDSTRNMAPPASERDVEDTKAIEKCDFQPPDGEI